MGLDMYLSKIKRNNVAYWRKANEIHAWFERKYGENEGLENCRDYPVSKDDLIELRSVCKRVLASCKLVSGIVKTGERPTDKGWEPVLTEGKIIEDPSVAKELLPTEDGFFFGSTAYDEYYVEDLVDTIRQLDEILEETDFEKEEIVYHAWW